MNTLYSSMADLWHSTFSLPLFCLLLFPFLVLKFLKLHKSKNIKLPPSPPSLPFIGHLHLLKLPFHRILQNLSDKYGPILSLSFGSRPVILISSLSAAQECFTKNDIVFSNRPRLLVGKYLNYDYTTIGFAPYGDHWRNLRRLAMTELLSTQCLNMSVNIRVEEFKLWLKNLFEISTTDFVRVDMKSKFDELIVNILMRMICGKRYFGVEVEGFEEAREFMEILKELFEQLESPNLGDYLPVFKLFDFQGIEKKMSKLRDRVDAFIHNMIERHREKKASSCQEKYEKSMIENLLSLQESNPEYYSDYIIKGHVMNMLIGGTETTTGTSEWAMSLLLNHPSVMKKAWNEINEHVGQHRLVEEADLSNLQYLKAIINETLRLFPIVPLLVPRESSKDCKIDEYYVPKGTMLVINAWAIHRDPKVWKEPTSFRPERFQELEAVEGICKMSIPFGIGRRACPGVGLAHKMLGLTLATLIQCFEWERIVEDEIDLGERSGSTMHKLKPLEAMCKVRSSMIHIMFGL